MNVRALAGLGVAASVILSNAAPARAQAPNPMTSDQLLSEGCGAGLRAVRSLREPGRYLVEMLVPVEAPRRAAVLRVDDRNGHWLYPATTEPRVVLAVPDSASGPINVSVAVARPTSGDDVACRPAVMPPQQTNDAIVAPSTAPLLPSSRVPDTVASCPVPFERGGRVTQPPNFHLPPALRSMSGMVVLALLVAADGSIARVRILDTPTAQLGAAITEGMQQVRMTPTVFRCVPIDTQMFLSIDITVSPRGP